MTNLFNQKDQGRKIGVALVVSLLLAICLKHIVVSAHATHDISFNDTDLASNAYESRQSNTIAHVDINGDPLRFNTRYYAELANGRRTHFSPHMNWDYILLNNNLNSSTPVVFTPRPGDTTTTRAIAPSEHIFIRNTNSNWSGFVYWNPSNTIQGGIHLTDARRARSFVLNDRRLHSPSSYHTIRNVATGRHAEMANNTWLNSGPAVSDRPTQHFNFIPAD